jgi:hypothetical protein
MLTPRQEEQTQRNNMFRTCCAINQKVCDVIIDGGNGENVIFEAMIRKLGLKTEKHPSPYKIRWIKRGTKKQVFERCHFTFLIRKHNSDSVLCDVVEMDACHIILERPWQYDVDTQHKGKDNVYIIFCDGWKIIFRPLQREPFNTPTCTEKKQVLLTTGSKFKE